MLKKMILAIAAASAALGASSAAFAHGGDWDHDHDDRWRRGRNHERDDRWGGGWRHERYSHRYYAPPAFVVVPAPRVVYALRPRVAYPYYAAPLVPGPVYAPAPGYSQPSVSIHFDLPL